MILFFLAFNQNGATGGVGQNDSCSILDRHQTTGAQPISTGAVPRPDHLAPRLQYSQSQIQLPLYQTPLCTCPPDPLPSKAQGVCLQASSDPFSPILPVCKPKPYLLLRSMPQFRPFLRKETSLTDPPDYRPFVLTSTISEVFQTSLHTQFLKHLESNSLFQITIMAFVVQSLLVIFSPL